ncbi:MAG: DNA polymerase III subunit alpha, partial [Gammaproteobacteria bacterium]|nr:DNA polymerase III subunit alpha [Gammaproteobacteria bacterium]
CAPDRFYIETQRLRHPKEATYEHGAIELANAHGVPVVATNDARFLTVDDYEAHEARVCIHDGERLEDPERENHYLKTQYLRSVDEMSELFSDLPSALSNTVEIAKRCNVQFELSKTFLPNITLPDGKTQRQTLRDDAETGLQGRLTQLKANDLMSGDDQAYLDRLNRELSVIDDMGFAGYFLIVADFTNWAREHGVPVGPGRGSGAGSLVAYAIGITDLDPLRYDLIFERFLNPERISMPDFDIDFCMLGRDRVIHYVAERYGHDHVAQIITHGTMAARAVVRDVGRVLGYAYGYMDRIAKLIPFEVGMTLEKALNDEEELNALYDEDDEVRSIINLAQKLEGLARNAGTHAGGVVIAPSPLTDFMPLYRESPQADAVTQFDMKDVEGVGLVKFDFLGLRTLTIID